MSLLSLFQTAISLLQQHPNSILTIAAVLLFSLAYFDYKNWYALGAGGIPHNPFGWLVQTLLRVYTFRHNQALACYDALMKSSNLEKASFLNNELPVRNGDKPKIGIWVAPHRQLEQVASEKLKIVRH